MKINLISAEAVGPCIKNMCPRDTYCHQNECYKEVSNFVGLLKNFILTRLYFSLPISTTKFDATYAKQIPVLCNKSFFIGIHQMQVNTNTLNIKTFN